MEFTLTCPAMLSIPLVLQVRTRIAGSICAHFPYCMHLNLCVKNLRPNTTTCVHQCLFVLRCRKLLLELKRKRTEYDQDMEKLQREVCACLCTCISRYMTVRMVVTPILSVYSSWSALPGQYEACMHCISKRHV